MHQILARIRRILLVASLMALLIHTTSRDAQGFIGTGPGAPTTCRIRRQELAKFRPVRR